MSIKDEICYNCTYGERNNQRTKSYWFSNTTEEEIYCSKDKMYVNKTGKACSSFVPCNEEKTGCFITTALVKILGADDGMLNTFRYFRDNVLQKDSRYEELLMEYDAIGPQISEKLLSYEGKEKLSAITYEYFLLPIFDLINRQDYEEAIRRYRAMIVSLKISLQIEDDVNNYNYIPSIKTYDMGHGNLSLVLQK